MFVFLLHFYYFWPKSSADAYELLGLSIDILAVMWTQLLILSFFSAATLFSFYAFKVVVVCYQQIIHEYLGNFFLWKCFVNTAYSAQFWKMAVRIKLIQDDWGFWKIDPDWDKYIKLRRVSGKTIRK